MPHFQVLQSRIHFLLNFRQADHSRASSNGGSPPRLVVSGVDDKERSVNSDEALDVLEDQGTTARREKKSFSGTRWVGAKHGSCAWR